MARKPDFPPFVNSLPQKRELSARPKRCCRFPGLPCRKCVTRTFIHGRRAMARHSLTRFSIANCPFRRTGNDNQEVMERARRQRSEGDLKFASCLQLTVDGELSIQQPAGCGCCRFSPWHLATKLFSQQRLSFARTSKTPPLFRPVQFGLTERTSQSTPAS